MSYQIECTPEYGILLWIEAPCGIKQPLMRWSTLEEVKTFGESILNFYQYRQAMLPGTLRKNGRRIFRRGKAAPSGV
jgi:hypothetical protein